MQAESGMAAEGQGVEWLLHGTWCAEWWGGRRTGSSDGHGLCTACEDEDGRRTTLTVTYHILLLKALRRIIKDS
jgi:hypothetical protein